MGGCPAPNGVRAIKAVGLSRGGRHQRVDAVGVIGLARRCEDVVRRLLIGLRRHDQQGQRPPFAQHLQRGGALRAESAHPDDVAIDPDLSRHGIPGVDVVTDSFDRARLIAERVEELDRAAIRESVIDRFSAKRMADGYEALYARMLGLDADEDDDDGKVVDIVRAGATHG